MKSTTGSFWSEGKVEETVSILLRTGVIISALVVGLGLMVLISGHAFDKVQYHNFCGEPEQLKNVGSIFVLAFSGDGRGIIQLGLLLLLATPPARVAFSIIAFAMVKDKTYVFVTTFVLCVLMYSILGSQ